jgi:ABC-2 type transport system ATP-binding protein
MSAVLTVTNARKQFGQTQALDGAAVALRPGEWLGLLGPNGAGKTTLIRAIAGRVKLDAGEITLLGQRISANGEQAAAARRQLGIVPQDIALYPLLTARENLQVFGELHGVTGDELGQRVEWALQWTGLADRANHLSKTFSGGMKRRLNIACGVLHKPSVVLLDEPTVGVDPQSRQRIWEMLAQLRDEGASLLLTTHQLDEAQHVCERIAIIDHGCTIADGTMDDLVNNTIGRGRRVTLVLDAVADAALSQLGLELIEREARMMMNDVAAELPGLLTSVRNAGRQVVDVRVDPPSLQAVFIHLTGHELRE